MKSLLGQLLIGVFFWVMTVILCMIPLVGLLFNFLLYLIILYTLTGVVLTIADYCKTRT